MENDEKVGSCEIVFCYKEESFVMAENIPNRTYFVGVLCRPINSYSDKLIPKLYCVWGDSIVPVDTKDTYGAPSKTGVRVYNYRPVLVKIEVTLV
jgi:hypothetical protein